MEVFRGGGCAIVRAILSVMDDGSAVRLFLGSQGLGAFDAWLGELPERPRRAVLIPGGAADGDRLRALGLRVTELDPESASPARVAGALARGGLVFVAGTDPMPLLRASRRNALGDSIVRAVREGVLAYAGVSAGACLAAPDLRWYAERPEAALGLVGFYPLVHANRGRRDHYAQLMLDHGERYDFVPLRDDQAVVVTGGTWQRRPSPIDVPRQVP